MTVLPRSKLCLERGAGSIPASGTVVSNYLIQFRKEYGFAPLEHFHFYIPMQSLKIGHSLPRHQNGTVRFRSGAIIQPSSHLFPISKLTATRGARGDSIPPRTHWGSWWGHLSLQERYTLSVFFLRQNTSQGLAQCSQHCSPYRSGTPCQYFSSVKILVLVVSSASSTAHRFNPYGLIIL